MFKTLNEVAADILARWTPNPAVDEALHDGMTAEQFVTEFHHTLGRWVRNTYGLWTPEAADLLDDIWQNTSQERQAVFLNHWRLYGEGNLHMGRSMHPDDASDTITRRVWAELKKRLSTGG